jgi:predicted RNA polymerase sigma factor
VLSAPTHHTDHHATHRAIDAVWRMESARIIAGLTRIVRDVGLAEELAQDALVAALEQWPTSSIPDNPGAWLMVTAKHRAIDYVAQSSPSEEKDFIFSNIAQYELKSGNLSAALTHIQTIARPDLRDGAFTQIAYSAARSGHSRSR